MIPTFDLDKLRALLKDFYTLTQIRITIFDEHFRELVAYPEERCAFCQIIRSDPAADAVCEANDREGCEIASRRRSLYTYQCHAGLTESLTPLYMGNIMIGYLFFGQIFSFPTKEDGWEDIRRRCRGYDIDLSLLREVCREKAVIGENYIASASKLMQAVASYLCLEQMATIRHEDLPMRIDSYLSSHFTEAITVPHLCEKFGIGKTPLYEIAKQLYGCGIAEHIRNLRMEKARHLLLENPDMRVGEIAGLCGYDDYNYFITVFRRAVGVSPLKYRKQA